MNKKMSIHSIVLCALFAALITVGTFIRIPVPPVPFTLQTLFVILAGLVLGAKLGTVSVLVYIALGLAGFPIFSSGAGGIGYVLMPTFGYMIGFVAGAAAAGKIAAAPNASYRRYLGASFAAMGIIYVCGMAYYYLMQTLYFDKTVELGTFIKSFFLLTAPKDIVTCFVLAAAAGRLRRAVCRVSR